jgi:alanine dehydrogenase
MNGLNVHAGQLTNQAVSDALGIPAVDPMATLKIAAE